MSGNAELSPADLRRVCDMAGMTFETTADLPFTKKIIGQPRGTRSIEFGIEIASPGFNIFVLGPAGSGRTTTIERFLQEKAAAGEIPNDWVYVQNFEDPRRPRAISLPAGRGAALRNDLTHLIDSLRREIPQAFETDEYKEALAGITQELGARRSRVLQDTHNQASEKGFAIVRTPDGLIITPMAEGKPMEMQAYEALSAEDQEALDDARRSLEQELDEALHQVLTLEQEARDQIAALDRRVAASVVQRYTQPLREQYAQVEEGLLHLDALAQDVVKQLKVFRPDEEDDAEQKPESRKTLFGRYSVNLVVDHGQTSGAPVVVESNPTYHNLVGRIEYDIHFGAPTTDFTNIKAGSLHRANGGYLVLRAKDLLDKPHAWTALKRALTDGIIRIEEPAAESIATKTLDPEPIPLSLKIVLMGSSALYYTLFAVDEDFGKLFKVKADFDAEMERTPENEHEYALFVAARCHEESLYHFDKEAVAKVVEHGSRLAGSQDKLTARFGEVANIVREASYWASTHGEPKAVVTASDVNEAIQERTYRSNMIEEKLRQQIEEGLLYVDTDGEVIGQVNGLYVVQIGDYSFGQPSRITAQVYMGRAGVVSIEREVKLTGPIHDRGVLTLIGYLGGTYAQEHPLSLSASLAFEQNYSGVEGDSASSAELLALLSRLANLPANQGLAVTGSVDQRGRIQPIGGVTHKIEGFYDVCLARGLTGEQGVIIPASNAKDLMLREEVVKAVAEGQFHIWAISTIDEGLELLTGVPAGVRGADHAYPVETVHGAVQRRLHQMAHELVAFEQDQPASD